MNEEKAQQRGRPASPIRQKRCPWCQGRLILKPRFPIRGLIPGEVRFRGEENIPEALRTIRAWVCATPHCRYRETA